MENLLEQAIELEASEYSNLKNPIFKGQTRLDDNYSYWIVFEEEGKLYKFYKTLYICSMFTNRTDKDKI